MFCVLYYETPCTLIGEVDWLLIGVNDDYKLTLSMYDSGWQFAKP